MERLLDDVLVGQQEMEGAIDAVCAQASRIIGRLQERASSIDTNLLRGTAKASGADRPPTPAMRSFVDSLARQKGLKPPRGYATSGAVCRAFLDQHASKKESSPGADEGKLKAAASTGVEARPAKRAVTPRPRVPKTEKTAGVRAGPSKPLRRAKGSADLSEAGLGETPLNIPFGNKDAALQLGARYRSGGWYAPPGVDLSPLRDCGWL
jgi:DNA topoisomerase-3